MKILVMLLAMLAMATVATADWEQWFEDGDAIVGATYIEGAYDLGPEAYIDLDGQLNRHHDVVALVYNSRDGGSNNWPQVVLTYVMSNDDAIAGLTWPDILGNERRLYFPAQDDVIRDVMVWVSRREPGVALGDNSVGELKGQWR